MTNLIEAAWSRMESIATARELGELDQWNRGRPATAKAKNYLRMLLRQSVDTSLVAELRAFFNERRVQGDVIPATEVSLAIRLLKDAR